MRRTLSAVITMGLVAALTLAPAASSAQEPSPATQEPSPATPEASPATPEEVVAAYVAGIAAGDADAILQASAVEEMATGFDFTAFTERLRAMSLATSLGPSEYALFRDANRYQQAALILSQVRNLVYGLLSGEEIEGRLIAPVDAERIAAFVAAVDPARLSGLKVLEVRGPDPEFASDERYLDNIARMAAVYGADELTERLALIELDGSTYGLGFTLLRYGDTWKVSSQQSVLARTPVFGTAEPMTRAEYDERTGG